ncbi:MAG: YbaK/EbsC family protein, partial [Sinomonas sp.]|nr:YbaK/EbsC family protein [Sinomonas sp.]
MRLTNSRGAAPAGLRSRCAAAAGRARRFSSTGTDAVARRADDGAATGHARFLEDAATRGLRVEIADRGRAKSLEEAAANLGIEPREIVKSLVVRHPDGSFLFALIPGDRQISWPKLRRLVGVNRLSMPPAEVALDATGYERGT